MIRSLLAGVAALALMAGTAFAQDVYSGSTTTTSVTGPVESYSSSFVSGPALPPPAPVAVVPAPPPAPGPNYSETTTTRHVAPNGAETERTDTYRRRQQVFYDPDGHLTERTTIDRNSNVTEYPPRPPLPAVSETRSWGPDGLATTRFYPDGSWSTTITRPGE